MSRPRDLVREALDRGVPPSRTVLTARPAGSGGSLTPYTLAELDQAVTRRAEALADAGARAGAIHPVVVEADEDGVLTLLALWRLGVTPAPLNPRLTPVEQDAARASLQERAAAGAQAVLWTSGTSGRPRGVALGHEALATHAGAVSLRLALNPERDAWLASLSLAHVGGLMILVRALLTGSGLVAVGPVDAEALVAVLEGGGAAQAAVPPPVTHLSLVPTQLQRLLEAFDDGPPPATLRCVLLGGAHTPRPLLDRALAAGWPVALTYGMTEMCSQVATATPDEVRAKPGAVGKALAGVELRLDEAGEILVRGATQASAYLDGTPLSDADCWYHTGDLGRLDEEGDLWITGRRGDRIISGGVNVDPAEVEDAVRAHPAVADVCVVGLPHPEWGEMVAACVVPVEGEFDQAEVQAWLRERLAGPKRPKLWRLTHALPLGPSGKVDRLRVREDLREA